MSRIELQHSLVDILTIMGDGNPGAVCALVGLIDRAEEIDPQNSMGGVAFILDLDSLEIYGTGIYGLWSDKCGKDYRQFCLLLRGWQLGYLKTEKIQAMANDQRFEITLTPEEWQDLDDKVCERLVFFMRPKKEYLP